MLVICQKCYDFWYVLWLPSGSYTGCRSQETTYMTELSLRTAIGDYGHTAPLKDGTIRSQMFEMEHKEISPVPMIFRRMVRALETFVDFNVAQGIIPEAVDPDDLFLTETLA